MNTWTHNRCCDRSRARGRYQDPALVRRVGGGQAALLAVNLRQRALQTRDVVAVRGLRRLLFRLQRPRLVEQVREVHAFHGHAGEGRLDD